MRESLADFSPTRDPVGGIAISAAFINDVAGWLLLACVSATATATFSISLLLFRIALILASTYALWFVLRPLVNTFLRRYPARQTIVSPNLIACEPCLIFALALCASKISLSVAGKILPV